MSFCMFTQCDQVIRVEPVLRRTSRRAGEPSLLAFFEIGLAIITQFI